MPEKVMQIEGEFQEGSPVWWMARVVTPDNVTIVQSTIDLGWTLDVYDLSSQTDPNTAIYSTSGVASAVVFNALQTDGFWGIDRPGYNFRHNVLASAFVHTGGHTYLFEYFLNSTQWGPIVVPFVGTCKSSRKV